MLCFIRLKWSYHILLDYQVTDLYRKLLLPLYIHKASGRVSSLQSLQPRLVGCCL